MGGGTILLLVALAGGGAAAVAFASKGSGSGKGKTPDRVPPREEVLRLAAIAELENEPPVGGIVASGSRVASGRATYQRIPPTAPLVRNGWGEIEVLARYYGSAGGRELLYRARASWVPVEPMRLGVISGERVSVDGGATWVAVDRTTYPPGLPNLAWPSLAARLDGLRRVDALLGWSADTAPVNDARRKAWADRGYDRLDYALAYRTGDSSRPTA